MPPMLQEHAAPPVLRDLAHAPFRTQAVRVVAALRVADLLEDGPLSVAELAARTGVSAPLLLQVLRMVASLGLLRSEPDGDGVHQRYALTDLGRYLQDGHPSAARDMLLTLAGPTAWACLGVLLERLTTARSGTSIAHGVDTFVDVLRQRPIEHAAHSRSMIAVHGDEPPAVARALDLSQTTGTIVDVGGGVGTLLIHLLARNPHLRGMLVDLPGVVDHARAAVIDAGVADRAQIAVGDYFEAVVPAAADVYLLSHILHGWDEQSCLSILRHCAAAMRPDSRLYLVESVLPPGDQPHFGKTLDMVMLTLTSGRERTADEYAALLAAAGLRLRRVIPTDSAASVLEVVRDTAS
ncbi:methyltransferase [Saccharopolyspora sp. K220]|uniref:ArsR family transcriptional regulator n=1 Tax=Saccharopolyspora soli TaxID=2926618 RepID=UPI001F59ED83|nr:ArsR family transcriptional regulator [Saccharopolyspora soli]MCI2423069.1 methyltransferase [Saccharopolyspora soli]